MSNEKIAEKIAEAYKTFAAAMNGDLRARADLRESMTTGDFPILLGQAYQRKLLAAYQTVAPTWKGYATRVSVPNFLPQKLLQILGAQRGLSRVPEGTEYPASGLSESQFEISVEKWGDRIPLTWEMLVNDQLGAFRNLDQRLATEARDTESLAAAGALLKADRKDINTDFFKGASAPASEPLTQQSLKDALRALGTKKGENGKTLVRPRMVLVVPPTLEAEAREILTASEIRTTAGDTTIVSRNPVAGAVDLVVDPNLLMSTHAKAESTWFLLPTPNSVRPAVAVAFLQGHENPDLRVKADTGQRPGGGSIAAKEGSFDDDTIQYRVRHVVGASALDPTFAFASRG